ncbi:hypothetical protein KC950_01925 [Candidatus Saccharibacteria bacterium]|nr:hypothetical protein [Candidatus Saccharibacteria bacterium]
MIPVIVTVLPVLLLLLLTEYLWRSNSLRGESARKLIHIVVGSYVAFWPFMIGFEGVQIISAAFLLVIGVSLKFSIFKAIHGVARRTWGEVLFAVGIGLIAVLTNNPWVYAACILHMSLADGFAALAGMRWGKNNSYMIGNYKKSIVGTGVFWFSSLLITGLAIANIPELQADASMYLLWLPIATSVTENLGVNGTDNVLVPLLVFVAFTL